MRRLLTRHPWLPYVGPFAIFIAILAVQERLAPLGRWEFPLRAALIAAVLYLLSRHVIDLRAARPVLSALTGVVVFALWITPDLISPAWRQSALFQNSLTGSLGAALPEHLRADAVTLVFRTLRAVVLVPIVEELFWRGWLMRWLISTDFRQVPVGAFSRASFLITAILFASEHGVFWDVGLLAGIAYNALAVRTRRLGDCILAHALTNACLSAYVIAAGRWEYWP